MSRFKTRAGGVLTPEFRGRVLDGDTAALRALVRQASGPNMLTLPIAEASFRMVPNGTGGDRLQFEGMFTALDSPFTLSDWAGTYTEIMHSGSLSRTLNASADIKFVGNHDWDAAPMARTTAGSLDVNPDGSTVARVDGARSDVAIMASAVEGGEWNAMSCAFWVTQQTWSPDYDQRDILEVDMDGGDVSVVTHPANPGTTGSTAMRAQVRASVMRSGIIPLLVERSRIEAREGKALSAATMEALQQVLDLIADADEALDDAQPLLADLMGVPNPDVDEPVDDDGADGDSQQNSAGHDPAVIRERLALAARARA